MTESGRVPQPLRLCRGCRKFVRLDHADCPFCSSDLDRLDADHAQHLADMRQAATELREALARIGQAGHKR